ncbi:MAG: hypothetical protein ABI561_04505 [Bradyrhizobium sp.]
MIDSLQASEALSDINAIVQRVRQSRIYNLASLLLIQWGSLVFAGNMLTYLWPRYGGWIWIAIDAVGVLGSLAISTFNYPKAGVRAFGGRMLVAFLLYFAFGFFFSSVLGHFTPRQLATFWSLYAMMSYTIAGLWFGYAFVALGLSITALTLIGYFFVGNWFDPWMAVVNGGGMILGGLWMRRS